MKVLTIKEPYATLIAKGIKKYEFRSWKTNYRGEIYIHAGKSFYENFTDFDLIYRPGEIVAKAEIVDVIELDEINGKIIHDENPAVYGFHNNGFAWVLGNVTELYDNKKIKGKLGIWNYEK